MSADLQAPAYFRNRLAILMSILLLGFVTSVVMIRWGWLLSNPSIAYLAEEDSAPWIRRDRPFDLMANSVMRSVTMFRREFQLEQTVASSHLRLRAFRQFSIWLDLEFENSAPLFTSGSNRTDWKDFHEVLLPGPLKPGNHVLYIFVENKGGPACLSAECSELGLQTDQSWQAYSSDRSWVPVRLACSEPPLALPNSYPTVLKSAWIISPILIPIFAGAFLLSLFRSHLPIVGLLTPAVIRYGSLLLWTVLCANNMNKVGAWIGFDLPGHLEYIQYVAKHHRIPLATEGWTMFQSPLFYLISAPFYSVFAQMSDTETCVRLLRFIPMLCGLLQVEICYRAARRVYFDCPDSQSIATLIGGFLPMNLYSSQYIGNEPLAGILTSLTILLTLPLICEPRQSRTLIDFLVLGAVWGFALLSKVSPFLLAPLLLLVVVYRGWVGRYGFAQTALHAFALLGSAIAVAGWFYLRNLIYLGRLFVGGWDQHRNVDWWQDPGYRTWTQLTSFGRSFVQPIYAGYWSLPDSLYSTLWTDGYLSGCAVPPEMVPWNVAWLETLPWLGFVPLICMILGGLLCLQQESSKRQACLVFSFAVIAVYLFAMVDLWIQLPIYSAGKSSYMLGTIPCFGLLSARGASPFLRNVWLRALLIASLTCWSVSVYASFFCIKLT